VSAFELMAALRVEYSHVLTVGWRAFYRGGTMLWRTKLFCAAIAVLVIAAGLPQPRSATADVIRLRGGGEIRGELQSNPRPRPQGSASASPKPLTIRTLTGATIQVANDEVEQVVRRRVAFEEYEVRRASVEDTVAAQWELAEWCRLNSLPRERRTHLERVVELDPDHPKARRGLGHVRDTTRGRPGEWKTQDALMEERGYVKHKGKYILPQQLDLIEEREQETEAEKVWFRQVRLWRNWIEGNRADRQAEGLKNLKAIDDPNAVRALVKTFRNAPIEAQRRLYVEILSRIGGDRIIAPLIFSALYDESSFVRDSAVDGIRGADPAKVVPKLVQALRSDANVVVNRAAAALSQVGDKSVVPQLIEALVTRHRYRYLVPDDQVISLTSDGQYSQQDEDLLPPEIAGMLRAGQLPFGVILENPDPPRLPKKPVIVVRNEENNSVLMALSTLTGENFGYDKKSWRRWLTLQQSGAASGGKNNKKAGAAAVSASKGSS
jgi:HEAT repeats